MFLNICKTKNKLIVAVSILIAWTKFETLFKIYWYNSISVITIQINAVTYRRHYRPKKKESLLWKWLHCIFCMTLEVDFKEHESKFWLAKTYTTWLL